MAKKMIEIGGRLHDVSTDHVVAGADEILYEPTGKKQSEVNVETYEHVANIDAALQELSPDQTEALALATDVNDLKAHVVRSDAQTLTDAQKAQALANVGISGIDDEPTAGSEKLVKSGGVDSRFSIVESRANGVDDIPIIDSTKNIAKSFGIASEFINKIGGSYLSESVHVTQGENLVIYRDILIKAEDVGNIKLKLIDEGNIINSHINVYFYYRGYTSDSDFKTVAVYNDGEYHKLIPSYVENKDVVRIRYDNIATRNVGTGNIQIEYCIDDKYFKADAIIPYNTRIMALEGDVSALENGVSGLSESVSELANEIEGTPQATIDPGYITDGTRFYYCTTEGYQHTKIAVTPGQIIDFKAGQNLTDYIVLKSYPESFSSVQVNFVAATGYSDRVRVTAGETARFTIPEDGHWLCTSWLFSNQNYGPSYVKSNGVDLINGSDSIEDRISELEEKIVNNHHSFLKYIKSAPSSGTSVGVHPKFEFYQYDGKGKYFELDIELCRHTDDSDYQNLWRITSGKCYDVEDVSTPICNIMDNGENEWACNMKDFGAIGGFVGGLHGGERIDLDTTNCFVKFFADGKLLAITDGTNDFVINCDKFEYIQKSALYIVKDSSTGDIVQGHPKYGYHIKITKFENCGYNVENRIEIDYDSIPYTGIMSLLYFSGLSCIGKGAATSAFLPTGILASFEGNNATIRSDNTKNSKIIYWNDTNDIVAEVTSGLLQGINDDAINTLEVYDRSADSKYYRYVLYNSSNAVDLAQVSPIVSFTNVKFK